MSKLALTAVFLWTGGSAYVTSRPGIIEAQVSSHRLR